LAMAYCVLYPSFPFFFSPSIPIVLLSVIRLLKVWTIIQNHTYVFSTGNSILRCHSYQTCILQCCDMLFKSAIRKGSINFVQPTSVCIFKTTCLMRERDEFERKGENIYAAWVELRPAERGVNPLVSFQRNSRHMPELMHGLEEPRVPILN
jgi:hypothetical protein